MEDFRRRVNYEELPETIYRYDSLDLVNQAIFTKDRPKSRLAQEYVALMRKIIEHNPRDREGALSFLNSLLEGTSGHRIQLSPEMIEERLEMIRNSHAQDSEVLFNLAMLRRREGRFEDALILFEEAIQLGFRSRGVLLHRAECRLLASENAEILPDILEVLNDVDASSFDVSHAVRLLRKADPSMIGKTLHTPALQLQSPEEKIWIARDLLWNRVSLHSISPLLSMVTEDEEVPAEVRKSATHVVILSLLATGRFRDAMGKMASDRASVFALHFISVFLYALAEWGETGIAASDLFSRVAELGRSEVDWKSSPNHHQMLAIALCATNDSEAAKQHVSRARQKLIDRPTSLFSYWRFLMVTHTEFFEDLDALLRMIGGEQVKPIVFAERQSDPRG